MKGLVLIKKIYSEKELQYIKDNYNIKTYKQIKEELNKFNAIKKDTKQVRTKAKQLGLSKIVNKYNRRYFKNIDTQEKAYWLGFIYADGYIIFTKGNRAEVSIELGIDDINHLKQFNQAIDGNVEITTRTRPESYHNGHKFKKRQTSSIRLYSIDMAKDLFNLGVVQNKTYRNEFPKVKKEYMNTFLLGFFDGDGHFYYNHKNNSCQVGFTNPNREFLFYIKDYIESLGIEVPDNIYQEKEYKSRLTLNSQSSEELLEILYQSSEIYLERKYNQFQNYLMGYAHNSQMINAVG